MSYCGPTGDAFRWPDVLNTWRHWETVLSVWRSAQDWPTRLCARAGVHDPRLVGAVVHACVDIDIDLRTEEQDWTIANVLDSAIAEQARIDGVINAGYFARTAPRKESSQLTRFVGLCDNRLETARIAWNGVMKRNVV